jgi:hypothetical protein
VTERDRAGERKVQLMSVWVGIGVALMVLGALTTLWISFLGAAVIASTPVFFTLRAALESRATPKRRTKPLPDVVPGRSGRRPVVRQRAPRRLRDHD